MRSRAARPTVPERSHPASHPWGVSSLAGGVMCRIVRGESFCAGWPSLPRQLSVEVLCPGRVFWVCVVWYNQAKWTWHELLELPGKLTRGCDPPAHCVRAAPRRGENLPAVFSPSRSRRRCSLRVRWGPGLSVGPACGCAVVNARDAHRERASAQNKYSTLERVATINRSHDPSSPVHPLFAWARPLSS